MGYSSLFVLFCVSWIFFFIPSTHQLQSSQTQVLMQLRKHLEYPKQLDIWIDHTIDFCSLPSSPKVNITCQDNSVTELKIMGDKQPSSEVSKFNGFPILNQTLSNAFSMDSFVTTLARLTSLRVLNLVSLGMWGQLPGKIHRLSSLEILDLSSNFLFGSIPPKISTMVKLQTLTLDNNFFNDTIPSSFDSLPNLTSLSLRNNEISGKVPDLSSLSSLHLLDLSENKLNSQLPTMPKALIMAFLNHNSFRGEIPKQYSQLGHLQHLDISSNALTGTPPAALFSLPNITYLNLASNLLSGSLSNHLSCGKNLGFVDISDNKLTGELPSCLSTAMDKRVVKYNRNCLSIGLQHQHPESHCAEIHKKGEKSGGRNLGILIGVIGGIFIVTVFVAFGFIVVCRRICPRGISEQHLLHKATQENSAIAFTSELLTNARFISEAAKLGSQGHPTCRPFSMEELKEATDNFDNSAFMGEGSYGKLYKGRLENGSLVAIRCLPLSKKYSIRNLNLRLDLLAKLRHPHLVCLLGHCIDLGGRENSGTSRVFLIYEYIPNGNYRSLLSEEREKPLHWSERLTVLIGVAKAVHFLHAGVIPSFLNNRLKTSNILLTEHKIAKLSDYGLSIVTDEIEKQGAKGEGQKTWQMTNLEDDVCSFGFILLESLVGPVAARKEASLLNELASFGSHEGGRRNMDPIVLATGSQESLSVVITIMNKCISSESLSRPSFEDILWNLQYASQVQATPNG